MAAAPRPCPVCGRADTADLGRVTHRRPETVAGVPIDLGETRFRLRACPRCRYQYKDPPIPLEKLLACYEQASREHWQESPDPRKRRFDLLKRVLEAKAGGRRILDVGCFNGAVLQHLGDGWERFGIEPSVEAARLAAERGVDVLAPTIETLPDAAGPFDAVLAVDVVEHLPDPMTLFRRAAGLLAPGGILVVLTGDTGAPSWRLQGCRYWYVSLPEHVGFFAVATMHHVAADVGLACVEHRRLSHIRSDPYRRLRETTRNLAYAAARRTAGFGLPALRRYVAAHGAPGWLSARDHMVQVMRKPERRDAGTGESPP